MRVPIRKPGKYTHLKPDPNMTQAKVDDLQRQLAKLKAQHPQAAKEMQRLAELGDFSENAAYQMAKSRLRGINERMRQLDERLKHAVIIAPQNDGTIGLGSTVSVELNGVNQTFLILGSSETSPGQGVISHHSPIGTALVGRKSGDELTIKLPDREITCRIIAVK